MPPKKSENSSDSYNISDNFIYTDPKSEEKFPQKECEFIKYFTDPNDSFYFPQWNPQNDPKNIVCPQAFKLYLLCEAKNSFPSRVNSYADSRYLSCDRMREDYWLCLRVKLERNKEKKKKMLEDAYPWVCDKTQGLRHRHVWNFRTRPPKEYDDKTISDEDYALMRESTIKYAKGGVASRLIELAKPHPIYSLLTHTPKQYAQLLKTNQIKGETTIDVAKGVKNAVDESLGKDQSKWSQKDRAELTGVFADIAENSGEDYEKSRRKKEFDDSINILLNNKTCSGNKFGPKSLENKALLKERMISERKILEQLEKMDAPLEKESSKWAKLKELVLSKKTKEDSLVELVWKKVTPVYKRKKVEMKEKKNKSKDEFEINLLLDSKSTGRKGGKNEERKN